ncbi:MAG: hypothetical protein ACTJGV_13360 [Proteus vulgaris]
MNIAELAAHQKNLAQQIPGFIEKRDRIIQTAVNRANNYLNILNSGGTDVAERFIAQQRKITKAQPIPMDKKIEGTDYLPAVRHAFKGVSMPKVQVINSVEKEKQRNMGYILAGLLPIAVDESVVMTLINASPVPNGLIDVATIKKYLSDRLMSFLSFAHYQTALNKLSRALTTGKEITFSNYSIRDTNEIAYLVGYLYVFDFLYATKNNLTYPEVVAQAGGFISNVMTIHTGKNLEKMTGIDLGLPLKEALGLALKATTVSATTQPIQNIRAS